MNKHEFLEPIFMRMVLPRDWNASLGYITGDDVNESWIEITMPDGLRWHLHAEGPYLPNRKPTEGT